MRLRGLCQLKGKVTVKALPRPGALSTASVPPCAAAMWRAMARPSPAPPAARARFIYAVEAIKDVRAPS